MHSVHYTAIVALFVKLEPNYHSTGHEFRLTTRRLTEQISDGVTADVSTKEIRFDRFSAVQRERESLFWQLPSKFIGNQVRCRSITLRTNKCSTFFLFLSFFLIIFLFLSVLLFPFSNFIYLFIYFFRVLLAFFENRTRMA